MNPRILHLYEPTPESPFLSAQAASNHWLPGALRELDVEVIARPIAGTPAEELSELSRHFDVVHLFGGLPGGVELNAPAVQTRFGNGPFEATPLALSWRQARALAEPPAAVIPPGVAVEDIEIPLERGDHLVTVYDPARPAALADAVRVAHAVERELVVLASEGVAVPSISSALVRVEVLPADREPVSLATAAAYLSLSEGPADVAAVTAMAAGVPVLTLEGTAAAETIVSGESGFICREIEELTRAAERLDMLSRRNSMDRARALFDVRSWAMRMAETYGAMVRGERRRFIHPEQVAVR